MPIKVESEDGKEVEAFLPDEVEAQKTTIKTEMEGILKGKETELGELKEKLAKAERVSIEKTTNFQKYNEMTDEQKKAYDNNTVELLKRIDALTEDVEKGRTTIQEKEKKENESAKSSIFKNVSGGNEETTKKLEENYAKLSGMPETNAAEIAARVAAAAQLSGIVVDPRNPLFTPFSGEAPAYKDKKDYTETAEGKTAATLVREAMGIKSNDK